MQISQVAWARAKEWDERYYMNIEKSLEEYRPIKVARAEGPYLLPG